MAAEQQRGIHWTILIWGEDLPPSDAADGSWTWCSTVIASGRGVIWFAITDSAAPTRSAPNHRGRTGWASARPIARQRSGTPDRCPGSPTQASTGETVRHPCQAGLRRSARSHLHQQWQRINFSRTAISANPPPTARGSEQLGRRDQGVPALRAAGIEPLPHAAPPGWSI